ncbi:MAG: ExbD/TolR family protein [Deltaproteobacteria bacterium]|nr:ExbD/TolR family protein [Deltaproteobacteria bacterium]
MAAVNLNGARHRLVSDINVTPLVDVMLVLLIIFMVTAPLLQQGLPVNLPQAAAPAVKRTKSDVILTIRNDQKVFVGDDKKAIPIDALGDELTKLYAAKEQKDLFLKADTDLRYGTVVQVMSIAKKAGVERIGMLTQPELKTK